MSRFLRSCLLVLSILLAQALPAYAQPCRITLDELASPVACIGGTYTICWKTSGAASCFNSGSYIVELGRAIPVAPFADFTVTLADTVIAINASCGTIRIPGNLDSSRLYAIRVRESLTNVPSNVKFINVRAVDRTPRPILTIALTPLKALYCPKDTVVLSVASLVIANNNPPPTFQWLLNDSVLPGSNSPILRYTGLQPDDCFRLLVTKGNTCAANDTGSSNSVCIQVKDLPILNVLQLGSGCADSLTRYRLDTANLGPGVRFRWTINGALLAAFNDSLTFRLQPGQAQCRDRIQAFAYIAECPDTVESRIIAVQSCGKVRITTVVPTAFCPGDTARVSYTTTSCYEPGNVFTFFLSDKNGSFANQTDIGSRADTSSGAVTVRIPLSADSGTNYRIRVVSSAPVDTGVVRSVALTVYSRPGQVFATPVVRCGPGLATARVTSLLAKSFAWYTSALGTTRATYRNGSVATTDTLTVFITADITFFVEALNGAGCPGGQRTPVTLRIAAPLLVTAGPDQEVCANSAPVALVGGIPSGGIYSGTGVVGPNFNPTGLVAGPYTVKYVFTSPIGCKDSANKIVTIKALPVVNAGTPDSTICVPGPPVSFLLEGFSPAGGIWTSANSSLVTGAGQVNKFALSLSGPDTLTYTVISAGCTGSAFRILRAVQGPQVTVTITAPVVCGTPGTVSLAPFDNTWVLAWSQNGVPGFIPTGTGPSFGGFTGGSYELSITGPTNCSARQSFIISELGAPPVSIIGINSQYCSNADSDTLTASIAGGTWSSTPPGFINATTGIITPSLGVVGTIKIFYTVTNSGTGCTSADSASTTLLAPPGLSAEADTTTCTNSALITLSLGGVWSGSIAIAPASPAPGQRQFFNPALGISVNVLTKTAIVAGCTSSIQRTILLITTPKPLITPSGVRTICQNGSVQLVTTLQSGILLPAPNVTLTLRRVGSSVAIASNNTGLFTINSPGTYVVDAQRGISCKDSSVATLQVVVDSIGPINAGADAFICRNAGPLVLVGTPPNGAGFTTIWRGPVGVVTLNGTTGNYEFNPGAVAAGTAQVEIFYIVRKGTCIDSARRRLLIQEKPAAVLTAIGSANRCGFPVSLSAGAGSSTLTYTFLRDGVPVGTQGSTNPVFIAIASGSYRVVVFSSGTAGTGCPDTSAAVNVIISTPPVMPAGLIDISACMGGAPVALEAPPVPPVGNFTAYAWSGPGASAGPAPYQFRPSIAGVGNHVLKIVVTNGFCKDSATKGAAVFAKPTTTVTVRNTTSCIDSNGRAFLSGLSDTTNIRIDWLNPNNQVMPTHADTIRGLYQGGWSVVLTDKRTGCTSDIISFTVTAPGTFQAVLSGLADNAAFCRSDSTLLISALPAGGTFRLNGGAALPGPFLLQINDQPAGLYTLTYNVTDGNGCQGRDTLRFTVKKLPLNTITASAPIVCQGKESILSTGTLAPSTVRWFLNYPTPAPGANTGLTYAATQPGSYLAQIDSNGCSTLSNSVGLSVVPGPVASITTVGNPNGCVGSTINLVANGAQPGDTITWFSGTTRLPNPTPVTTLPVSQNGSFRVRIANAACADTSAATFVAFTAKPVAAITSTSLTPCFADSALLSSGVSVAVVRQVWYFQPNLGSTARGDSIRNTSTIYAKLSGRYTLRVINLTLGCDSSTAIAIQVQNRIDTSLTITGATRFCQGSSVVLATNDNNSGSTISWINTAGGTPVINRAFTITTAGTYFARIVLNGCRDSSRRITVTVDSIPKATLVPNSAQTVCQDALLVLRANKGASLSYTWPGLAESAVDTLLVPTGSAGSFTYTVTVRTPFCFATSAPVNVLVKPSPTASLTAVGNINICPGQSVTLVGNEFNGAIPTFYRNTTEVVPGTATPPVRVVTLRGSYSYELNLNGCRDTSASIKVFIPVLPKPNAGPDRQFCVNAPIYTITDFSPALDPPRLRFIEPYITGDLFNPLSAGIGTKTVTLALADSGCSITDTAIYVVVPGFQTTISALLREVCPGVPVLLTATVVPYTAGAIYTYQWRDSLGNTIANATDSVYTVTQAGRYSALVTLGECSATTAVATVRYTPITPVQAGNDTTVCITFPAFNLSGRPGNGLWSGNGVSPDGRFVPGTPTLGANKLRYTTNQNGCIFSDSLVVTVNPNPLVEATYTSVISGKDNDPIDILESAELKASGADTYVWGPQVNLSSTTGPSVIANPIATQLYQVVGTAGGCSASDTVRVLVRTDVRVANGFSPNADGQNDFWNIYNIQAYPGADIKVFNRWGALVYKVRGSDLQMLSNYWDGKSEGKDVPVSTYYYVIDLNNNQKPYTGSITLVR